MTKISLSIVKRFASILTFAIPFLVNYDLILDYFYRCQAPFLDTGLISGIMWRNTWALYTPEVSGSSSFIQTHTTFIYWISSAISSVLPLNSVQNFGLFLGLAYAIQAIVIYYFLLWQQPTWRTHWGYVGASGIGVLFAFNGITQAMMGYPHTEIAGSVLLIAFLCCWASRRYYWAIAPFVLCLMVREDLGFHIFGILGLVLFSQLLNRQFWQDALGRWTCRFAIIAFLYSCGALILQDLLFQNGDDALSRQYLGYPPFAHISATLLKERLSFYLSTKQYLYLPALSTFFMALYPLPRMGLTIGFIAYVPWFLLHLLAVSEQPGLLKGYYAFPYVVSLAWPLIWPWIQHQPPSLKSKHLAVRVFIVGLVLSVFGGWISPTAGTVDLSAISYKADVRAFNALERAINTSSDLKPLYVDESVATLFPKNFQPRERLESYVLEQDRVGTVLYCEPSLESKSLEKLLRSQSFEAQYQVRNTPLKMQTNVSFKDLHPRWQAILDPIDQ
ncbi:hypothetical protein KR51_00012110 [Rubidibacter lacunae KORDI 51-2]|uniref:DUF2079 domain-containing protein n=1 Tax=Rubidibacter lacunae KORDI 51-2 TaxID=582515 RepID=U5DKD0_9CHRO|nr:hypothetical protein [Rubidibacter lacunae]ERN42121.1 hypothetical protein KR51_00012110 [Rubidibacter lacunae KORDI 51-2]